MTLPVSQKFDLLDWNIRASKTSDTGDATLSDQSYNFAASAFIPRPNVDVSNGYVSFFAQAANRSNTTVVKSFASVNEFGLGIPDTYTFEFDILLDEANLPIAFDDPNQRLFVGVFNQQGSTAGFLFSHQGIAVATHAEDPDYILLNGSRDLLFDMSSDGNPLYTSVTIRAIVDGEDNRLTVYIGNTGSVYLPSFEHLADIDLKYNIRAPSTINSTPDAQSYFPIGDGFAAQASAQPLPDQTGRDCLFTLASIRISSQKVTPESKPVATAFSVRNTLVGTPITVFGSRSYDARAAGYLEYNWEIEVAPEGSSSKLQGSKQASVTIGTEAANNELRISYRKPTAYANTNTVLIRKSPAGQSLSIEVDLSDNLTINLGTSVSDVITTTAADLEKAFFDSRAVGYNETAAELFSVDLINTLSTNQGLVPEGTFQLSGGSGSSLDNPIFIPDTPGVYVLSLTVFNGFRTSSKAKVVFTVGITNQLRDHRPNSKYIFKYLPDFWNLVQDKDKVSTIWSAATQVLSSDMLTLWQNDYAKTIKDISRRYQRRWQSYTGVVEVPSDTSVTVTFPKTITPPQAVTVTPNVFDTHSNTARITTPGGTTLSSGKCLVRGRDHQVKAINITGVFQEIDVQGIEQTYLTSDGNSFPYVSVLAGNSNGFFVRDPAKAFAYPETSDIFTNVVYPLSRVATGIKGIRLFDATPDGSPIDLTVAEQNPSGKENTIRLDTSYPVDGRRYLWQHISEVTDVTVEQTPFLSIGSTLDLSTYSFDLGDYVDLTVVDPYTATDIDIRLPIIAQSGQDIFVDWTSLLSALEVASVVGGDQETWTLERAFIDSEADINEPASTSVEFTLNAIVKASVTFQSDELVDVPRLGTSTIKSSMHQNVDYHIEDYKIHIKDWLSCKAKTRAFSTEVELVQPATFHPKLTHESQYSDYAALGATTCIIVDGPDSNVYGIVDVVRSGDRVTLVLDEALKYTDTASIRVPRFSAYSNTAGRFWAEISYFDNTKTIEGNFGLFVGLPEETLKKYDSGDKLDYLSVVRSMWFALMSGPSLDNLQMALQTLFNVPYTERSGQVTFIQEPTPTEEGFITVEEENGRTSTYRYPFGAELANNPTTDRVIKAFPAVDSEEDVAPSALEDYRDSVVPAYAKLVDVIKFDDYISNPDLIDLQLQGQDIVKKYHTFVVDVPLQIVNTTEVFPLVTNFLSEAKPAHTNFILVGSVPLQDGISVEETFDISPTVLLRDTPHTASYFSRAVSNENSIWPEEQTTSRTPVPQTNLTWTVADGDVRERYESSYSEGVFDDYSGDGSFNKRHRELDMINRMSSDIDVLGSYLWVPCTFTPVGGQPVEFMTGEPVRLKASNGSTIASIWDQSPPVIEHIGASVHPRVPFDVYSPQMEHPNSYLLLGFENQGEFQTDFYKNISDTTYATAYQTIWGNTDCYGNESRLDVLADSDDSSGAMYLEGMISGARATLDVVIPDRTNAAHSKYFLLDNLFRFDKLIENGPRVTTSMSLTAYIPVGGEAVSAFQGRSASFTTLDTYRQVQQQPYDPNSSANEQFIPSFSPGLYTQWSSPPTNMRWGFTDVGQLSSTPTAINAFTPASTLDLQNVHIGYKKLTAEWYHYTQGFTQFYIPPPVIVNIVTTAGPTDLRIEGYYFVEPDSTQTAIPTANPSSFDGTIGGCWVFFRHTSTGIETATHTTPTFETGTSSGRTVLGIDGANQTSTGHILMVDIPNLSGGYYDVIVRNYRPYKLSASDSTRVHVDECVLGKGYFHSPTGWGPGGWGSDPYGGDD